MQHLSIPTCRTTEQKKKKTTKKASTFRIPAGRSLSLSLSLSLMMLLASIETSMADKSSRNSMYSSLFDADVHNYASSTKFILSFGQFEIIFFNISNHSSITDGVTRHLPLLKHQLLINHPKFRSLKLNFKTLTWSGIFTIKLTSIIN